MATIRNPGNDELVVRSFDVEHGEAENVDHETTGLCPFQDAAMSSSIDRLNPILTRAKKATPSNGRSRSWDFDGIDFLPFEGRDGLPRTITPSEKSENILSILSKTRNSLDGVQATPAITVSVPQGLRRRQTKLAALRNDQWQTESFDDENGGMQDIVKSSRSSVGFHNSDLLPIDEDDPWVPNPPQSPKKEKESLWLPNLPRSPKNEKQSLQRLISVKGKPGSHSNMDGIVSPFGSHRSDDKGVDDEDDDFSFDTDDMSASLQGEPVTPEIVDDFRSNRTNCTMVVVPKTEADVAPAEEPVTITRFQAFMTTADDWIKRKLQYVYVFATLYVAPVSVAIYCPLSVVSGLYYTSIGCVVFVNFWMLCEAVSAFYYTSKQRTLHHSRPKLIGQRRLGAIVAAYLPNELTVLIDTVRAVSRTIHELPEGTTLDIVLSHNGGKKEQRIALLEDLRKIECELPPNVKVHELNVISSTSKAENVNAALAFLEELGSIRGKEHTQLAMYDADHQPIPEAWRYALETMQDQKADMVMGRCTVRDGLKTIAVEFDILYAVAHAGGRCVRGFGFFGGSNGYWDYDTLVETGMDEGMLTEDVDSSFRAQAAGHRMTYDSTIVSFEESPPDFSSLFKQRLRWSQGWYEVTMRQITLPFRRAPGLTLWSRFCIFLLLPFRELYVYLSSFTVPIAIVYLLRMDCGWECVDYRLMGLLAFCLQVPISNTFAAWWLTKDRTLGIHYRMPDLKPWDYYRYILVSFPYELFKIHVTIMSHARQAMGLNKWVVTKRKTTKDPSAPIYTMSIYKLIEPEVLVTQSPYAPAERQLFAGTYDEKRAANWGENPIVHGAILITKENADYSFQTPLTLSRRYSSGLLPSYRSQASDNNSLDISLIEQITEAMRTKTRSGRLRDPVLEKALHFRVMALQELMHYVHAVQFPDNDYIETLGAGASSIEDLV